jgi:hypothetical protein
LATTQAWRACGRETGKDGCGGGDVVAAAVPPLRKSSAAGVATKIRNAHHASTPPHAKIDSATSAASFMK